MNGAVDGAEREEREYESQMARSELLKWKVGLQRMLTSFGTMERQRGVYEAKVKETGTFCLLSFLPRGPHPRREYPKAQQR